MLQHYTPTFLEQQRKKIIARIERYTEMQHPNFQDETDERKIFKAKFIPILRKALKNIESGEYGICLDCEEPICIERLKSIPAAFRCTSCQTKYEVNHDIRRT